MADTLLTLTDLLRINDRCTVDLGITDLLDDAPVLAALAADIASNGTQHSYLKEIGAPVVGFRQVNEGRAHDASEDTRVTIALKILDATFHVDQAAALSYTRGGPMALVQREAKRHLKAAFFLAEQQIINGTGNAADGFTGLADATYLDTIDDIMVIGAGGATDLTSVWLIRTNNEGRDCQVITGESGQIEIGETFEDMVEDGDGDFFPVFATAITGWLGLQIGSARSVGRICNIDNTTHTLTDDLIYRALENFPASRQPTFIAMNRRSLRQLRESRTATNATGAPAPRPTEVDGFPIVVTDAIANDETACADTSSSSSSAAPPD